MIQAYRRLKDEQCPKCGRPLAVHDEDKVGEYHTGWITCTSEQAIQKAQREYNSTSAGKQAEKDGTIRLQHWIAWRDCEGRPEWTMKD